MPTCLYVSAFKGPAAFFAAAENRSEYGQCTRAFALALRFLRFLKSRRVDGGPNVHDPAERDYPE